MGRPRLLKIDSGLLVFVKTLSWLTRKPLLPKYFLLGPRLLLQIACFS